MTCVHASKKFTLSDGWVCKICDKVLNNDDIPSRDGMPLIGFGDLRVAVSNVEAREKRWAKDMPAYKRLRAQGLQPKSIDGSAHLEARAETRFEVESGQVLPGQAKKIETAVSAIESLTGKSVYNPDTTPVNL